MEIKTKFDIGQEVYYFGFNNTLGKRMICSFTICSINIFDEDCILYTDYYSSEYSEWTLFATKEEAEQKLKEIQNAENS